MKAFFLLFLLFAGFTSAFAADPADAPLPEPVAEIYGAVAGRDVPEAAGEGNPVAEIAGRFGVTWPTLVAQMINFCIVAFLLYRFAVKPIAVTLEERQKKIADGLQYAEEMKRQLAEAERERAEKIKAAAVDAQRIMNEARDQSKELIEKKIQEASAQAEALIRKAGEASELERQRMLSEVRQEVARLVVATSSKVLSRELSETERQSFSESAARELATNDSRS